MKSEVSIRVDWRDVELEVREVVRGGGVKGGGVGEVVIGMEELDD